MIPQANQIYRHFKGNLYKIITVAVHTETEEELVIYQALYGDFEVYARPLSMFMSEVDHEKYPEVAQKMRFEPVEQMVQAVAAPEQVSDLCAEKVVDVKVEEKKETLSENESEEAEEYGEEVTIDPLLEAYLDTDSYREKLNVLHGLQHRITEHMLNTMAIVIDFELPEGDIRTKYDALNDCLLTKEKYECNRII
ncbi:MAG: DUF1653 domain-containing protein [Lachnospiraceae bacterium]|nr:DUF1653 domain-containing protein [Lachnospiraceae bacterium]